MNELISEELYREIIEDSFGTILDNVWYWICSSIDEGSYEDRKKVFVYIVEKAMFDGKVKLADNGVFLEGSIKEQAEKFYNAFPDKESDISDIMFCINSKDEFWVPGGAVWIKEDGAEIWT